MAHRRLLRCLTVIAFSLAGSWPAAGTPVTETPEKSEKIGFNRGDMTKTSRAKPRNSQAPSAPTAANPRGRATPPTTREFPYSETRTTRACPATGAQASEDPCSINQGCDVSAGEFAHFMQFRVISSPTQVTDWQTTGMTCAPQESPGSTITAGDVLHEFKRYAWPSAELIIEPKSDFILVNRNTAARAPDNGTITKNITLLGETVTLEATPTHWTWHWGDNSTHTTDHPGQPHPHANIHHTWTHTGATTARVDITYTGRYRINNGPWQPLPGTHTVRGPATTLNIVQAALQLIP